MSGTSLLAQLFPYFRGSQEDVATTSLQYIVSSCAQFNSAFTELIASKLNIDTGDTVYQYKCQVTGKSEEKERPDLAGFDSNGNEQILCEAKFYAALTYNQPNTYLQRLIEENGKGLVFICPKTRIISLWSEIVGRAKEKYEIIEINKDCIEVQRVRLSIITWTEILNKLIDVALYNSIDAMDVKELLGYCEKLDSDAFIPFDELDFGIENGIKQRRHVTLLDTIVETLKKDKTLEISTSKLKKSPQIHGYTRYFRMKDFCVTLDYDTTKWININSYSTPYWIRFSKENGSHWIQDEKCKKAMLSIPEEKKDGEYIALIAPCYVVLDDVVESIKRQIVEYFEIFVSVT